MARAEALERRLADADADRDRLRRYGRDLATQNDELRARVPDAPSAPILEGDPILQWEADARGDRAGQRVHGRSALDRPRGALPVLLRWSPLTVGGYRDRLTVDVATRNVEQGWINRVEDEEGLVTARLAKPEVEAADAAVRRITRSCSMRHRSTRLWRRQRGPARSYGSAMASMTPSLSSVPSGRRSTSSRCHAHATDNPDADSTTTFRGRLAHLKAQWRGMVDGRRHRILRRGAFVYVTIAGGLVQGLSVLVALGAVVVVIWHPWQQSPKPRLHRDMRVKGRETDCAVIGIRRPLDHDAIVVDALNLARQGAPRADDAYWSRELVRGGKYARPTDAERLEFEQSVLAYEPSVRAWVESVERWIAVRTTFLQAEVIQRNPRPVDATDARNLSSTSRRRSAKSRTSPPRRNFQSRRFSRSGRPGCTSCVASGTAPAHRCLARRRSEAHPVA